MLPAVAASNVAEATASRVDLKDTTIIAPLSILRTWYAQGSTPSPDFHVMADYLYLELDHADAATGRPAPFMILPTTQESEHRHAVLTGTGNDFDGVLFILPFGGSPPPTVTTEQGCASVERSDTETERTEAHIRQRPAREQHTAQNLHVQPCTGTMRVTIEGDFTLQLWQWNATLTSDQGTRELRTGIHHTQDGVELGSADEAFIVARSARLTIPAFSEDYHLLLDDADAPTTSIQASNVKGTLHAAEKLLLEDDELVLMGDLAATIRGTGPDRFLSLTVTGSVESATVDGATVPTTVTTAAPKEPTWGVPWTLALLGTVTAFARRTTRGLRTRARAYRDPVFVDIEHPSLRERRIQGLHIQAARLKADDKERRFLRLRRRARRLAGDDSNAWLLEGEALLQVQDMTAARIAFQNALRRSISEAHHARAYMGLAAADAVEDDFENGEQNAIRALHHHREVFRRALKGNAVFGRLQDLADTLLAPEPRAPGVDVA